MASSAVVPTAQRGKATCQTDEPSREASLPPGRDHVHVIRPAEDEEQVLVVRVWLADALQPGGGPAAAVAVTSTFWDGTKPCIDAGLALVPEK